MIYLNKRHINLCIMKLEKFLSSSYYELNFLRWFILSCCSIPDIIYIYRERERERERERVVFDSWLFTYFWSLILLNCNYGPLTVISFLFKLNGPHNQFQNLSMKYTVDYVYWYILWLKSHFLQELYCNELYF